MASKKIPDLLSGYVGLEKHRQSIYLATKPVNVWVGAVRAGKTTTMCHGWSAYFLRCPPGSKHVVVGQTMEGARAVLIEDNLAEMFGDQLIRRQSYYEAFGRKIYVMGAYDTRARQRLAGRTFWSALCDEVNTWQEEYYRFLRTRLSKGLKRQGTKSHGVGRMYLSANPEGPYHWLKQVIDKGLEAGNLVAFQFGMRDNEFLDEGYIAEMEADMRAAGPSFYGKYMLGEWVAAEEAIYPMLPDAVVDEVPDGVEILTAAVGADHGSKAATAFIYLGLGSDGNIYVLGEYYWDPRDKGGKRLTVVEQAEAYSHWIRQFPEMMPTVFVDPNAQSLGYALNDMGHRAVWADNDVGEGIRETAILLGKGMLRIVSGDCPKLLGEMSNYSWDKAADTGKYVVHKEADHACDALRYAVRGTFMWWQDKITWQSDRRQVRGGL